MKKVLFVASVIGHIKAFHLPYLEMFKQKGYEVHVAAYSDNDEENIPYCDKFYNIKFNRSPFRLATIYAYKQLKRIVKTDQYDIIHCHTPVASVLTRFAARNCKNTTLIYTAHGFHFFKGAPLINWMLYYPVERYCARYTDKLITINKEDYDRAKELTLRKSGESYYIPGVGLDLEKINAINIDREAKRKELGIPINAFLIVSVGELNKNKNHKVIIEALFNINNPQIHYVICGQGVLKDYLKDLIKKHGLENQVHLLGYRKDIIEINKCADLFAFPSRREGLGLAALEAMACGLPIVTSNVHGIIDYSQDGITGYNCNPNSVKEFKIALDNIFKEKTKRNEMGSYNIDYVRRYDLQNVKLLLQEIYSKPKKKVPI